MRRKDHFSRDVVLEALLSDLDWHDPEWVSARTHLDYDKASYFCKALAEEGLLEKKAGTRFRGPPNKIAGRGIIKHGCRPGTLYRAVIGRRE
jgi:hypothetical protein